MTSAWGEWELTDKAKWVSSDDQAMANLWAINNLLINLLTFASPIPEISEETREALKIAASLNESIRMYLIGKGCLL